MLLFERRILNLRLRWGPFTRSSGVGFSQVSQGWPVDQLVLIANRSMQWRFILFAMNFIFVQFLTQMHQCRMYLNNNFYGFTNINSESPHFLIENQQKTNNELGEMKGIFYQYPIQIHSGRWGATDDPATTLLYMSLLLHFSRLLLSSSELLLE